MMEKKSQRHALFVHIWLALKFKIHNPIMSQNHKRLRSCILKMSDTKHHKLLGHIFLLLLREQFLKPLRTLSSFAKEDTFMLWFI
jgi:hypothetical protein